MLGCALAEEDRPGGFSKCLPTILTAKPLYTPAGLAEFFKVLLLTVLKLPVVWAGFIWTEIAWFSKLFHVSPSDWFAWSLHQTISTLKRETTQSR